MADTTKIFIIYKEQDWWKCKRTKINIEKYTFIFRFYLVFKIQFRYCFKTIIMSLYEFNNSNLFIYLVNLTM